MKKISLFIFATFLLASCNTASIYTTSPCDIEIRISEGTPTASYVLADFAPSNGQVYYYANCLLQEAFSAIKSDESFMQLCLDTEYKDYINWRYELLAKEEQYIASFSSHSLYYGNDSRYFKDLKPNTTYVLFAFCVDPDTIRPTGKLYYIPFTTGEMKDMSDMTFQAMFKERGDGTYISIMPSNDKEQYIWSWEDMTYMEKYGYSADTFIKSFISTVKEYGMGEYIYTKGAQTYKCIEGELEPKHKYILMAAGYDGDLTTDVYSLIFEYPVPTEDPIPLKVSNPSSEN